MGLYHSYVRGFDKDTRTHRLYIVTSGGCTSMCDEYFNLSVDVRHHMTCSDLYHSEETWFLRKACQRNNARVLKMVADEFNLPIPLVTDPYR